MTKRSRLAIKNVRSGFRMVKKQNGGQNHSKTGHKSSFRMVGPSIDRFVNKGHKKNILFMAKRSRLEFENRTQKVSAE
jgi:uncharacterized protein YcbK (DUF882 family)